MTQLIKVENLNKTFKTRTNSNIFTGIFKPKYRYNTAVNNVSFEVNEGESLAFLGPNGAGKTTTTKMLTGLIHPTSGNIDVLGYTPSDRNKQFLMSIGLVMGNKSGLSWDLTANQSFNLLKQIYKLDDNLYKNRLNRLIDLLDVSKHLDKQVRRLSLGERMKLELIGSILHSPKILFLDEPTIGLDITSKKNIRVFLREIQKESNITTVLTSHDMDDIEKVCDRVIVINKGNKVYDGNLNELMSKYNKQKYIKVYFENTPTDLMNFPYASIEKQSLQSIESQKEKDSITFQVERDMVSKFIAEIVNKYAILDIDIVSVPLEDIIEDIFNNNTSVESIR